MTMILAIYGITIVVRAVEGASIAVVKDYSVGNGSTDSCVCVCV
jgi:hypothetical protein